GESRLPAWEPAFVLRAGFSAAADSNRIDERLLEGIHLNSFPGGFQGRAEQRRFADSLMIRKVPPRFAISPRIIQEEIQVLWGIDVEGDTRKVHDISSVSRRSGLREMTAEAAFTVLHHNSSRRYKQGAVCSGPVSRWNQCDRFGCGIEHKIDLRRNKPRQVTRNRKNSR